MRTILGFIVAIILAATTGSAAPPKYSVENRIPAASKFKVENLVPDAPGKTFCNCEFSRKCTCWDDECICPACKPAPAVEASPKKAESKSPSTGKVGYNASHRCPNCGHQSPAGHGTWIVSGYVAGGHTHTCDRCGQTWYH